MIAIRTWLALAVAALALPGCSHGHADGAAPANITAAHAAVANAAAVNMAPANTAQAGTNAGTGAMQALLASLPPPAPSAADAAAQFTWIGEEHGPAGTLSVGLDALMAARLSAYGRNQLLTLPSQAAVPIASPFANPATAEAMAKKVQSMGQAQQIAYAMQLSRQMSRQMAAQTAGSGGEVFAAIQPKIAEGVQQLTPLMMQLAAQQSAADADKTRIEQQAAAAHTAIDNALLAALGRIPEQSKRDGSGKCLDEADARGALALIVQAADRQVAVADAELRQAAQWSSRLRSALAVYARGIDGLTAGIPADGAHRLTGVMRLQLASQMNALHGDPAVFRPYWQGVRDFDLAAAAEVHVRDALKANGGNLPVCK